MKQDRRRQKVRAYYDIVDEVVVVVDPSTLNLSPFPTDGFHSGYFEIEVKGKM